LTSHALDPGPRAGPDSALLGLLSLLTRAGYAFVTPNPSTHGFVARRMPARDDTLLRDIFGWCRPFREDQAGDALLELMTDAGILETAGPNLRTTVRVSTVDGRQFLHSAPTNRDDAVFLGPDSYRYARFLRQTLGNAPLIRRALDIGVGAGVGALTLAAASSQAEVIGSDVNPEALRLTTVNARHAGLRVTPVLASGVPDGIERFDLVVANPPFIAGDGGRTYRDGGDLHGAALALDWVRASLPRLAPNGRFILYTGAPIIEGRDVVRDTLADLAETQGMALSYEEIDPDIFGRTLRNPAYRDVERIAAIGAVITAP